MDYITELREGKQSLRLTIPEAWGEDDFESYDGILITDDSGVDWSIGVSFGIINLDRECEQILLERTQLLARRDLENYAKSLERKLFVAQDWNPLVEAKIIPIQHGKHEAFYVERWISCQEDEKEAIAELYIPTKYNTFHFTCQVSSEFVKAPLKAVQQALAWLINDSDLELLDPYKARKGEVELELQESIVNPPASYTLVPDIGGTDRSRKASFVLRSVNTVGQSSIHGVSLGHISVWKSPNEKITGEAKQGQLERYARQVAIKELTGGHSSSTGVPIQSEKRPLVAGLISVETCISSEPGGYYDSYLIERWFLGEDGTIFRISVFASDLIPEEEMRSVLEQTLKSWRRLPKTEQLKPKSPKKWWQVWK